ncbi:hypothetical protein D5H75_07580 [Bailinhaonella thermotolerans]|uniref:Uncharacterized protein n=2 Tax=Bailinhaonella thermotolerans TaxID=1070861 RepID=A0A3A4AYV3_9ACTN|nr:hypothetical protein D5H75_07580 [Bailinhaonella thermotolerans]
MLRFAYTVWLVALAFKVLGSSWDVSWHFKWLRDDLAPPHLLNTVGTVIAVVLTVIHGYTGYGGDKAAIRLIQWGTGVFLVAVPLDLVNHAVNGLDITSWSPSHILLYLGTALMIAGLIRGWFLTSEPGRVRTLVMTALFIFFLENTLFPNQHQEYGVREIASWDRGAPYAEPQLLDFAADQLGRPVDRDMLVAFSLPVPTWVYPVWAGVAGVIVLVVARRMIARPWAATTVAGVYVAYRALIWPILLGIDFPESAVPFYLLLAGLAVDLAFRLPVPGAARVVAGSLLTSGAVYGGILLQDRLADAPPISVASIAATAVLLAAAWALTLWYGSRLSAGLQPVMGARVSTTASP